MGTMRLRNITLLLFIATMAMAALMASEPAAPASGQAPTPTVEIPSCASGADAVGGVWEVRPTGRTYSMFPCLPDPDDSTVCRIQPSGQVVWDTGTWPPRELGDFGINRWYCDADQTRYVQFQGGPTSYTLDRLLLSFGGGAGPLLPSNGWPLSDYGSGAGDRTTRLMASGMVGGLYLCTDTAANCAAADPRNASSPWAFEHSVGTKSWPGGHWINNAGEIPQDVSWALLLGDPPRPTPTGPTRTPHPTATAPGSSNAIGGVWMSGTVGNTRWSPVPCKKDADGQCETLRLDDGRTIIIWDYNHPDAQTLAVNKWYQPARAWDFYLLAKIKNRGGTTTSEWPRVFRSWGPFWGTMQIEGDTARVYTCDSAPSVCESADPRVPDPEWTFRQWLYEIWDISDPRGKFVMPGNSNNTSWALVIDGATPPASPTVPSRTPTPTTTPTFTPTATYTPGGPTVTTAPTRGPGGGGVGGEELGFPLCGGIAVGQLFDHWYPLWDEQIEPDCGYGDAPCTCSELQTWKKEWFSGSVSDAVDCHTYVNDDGLADFPDVFPQEIDINGGDGLDFYGTNRDGSMRLPQSDWVYSMQRSPGVVTFAGVFNGGGNDCGSDWSPAREVRVLGDDGYVVSYMFLRTTAVSVGDRVEYGQVLGEKGYGFLPGAGGTASLYVKVWRYSDQDPNGGISAVLDPLGFQIAGVEDKWESLSGIKSQRLLPSMEMQEFSGPPQDNVGGGRLVGTSDFGCPLSSVVACPGKDTEIVDDSDAGFSCTGCSDEITSVFAGRSWEDNYRTMAGSGSDNPSGVARWDSSLPPGPYEVSVFLRGSYPELNQPVVGAYRPAAAARYEAAGVTVTMSQGEFSGWYLVGNFNYAKVSPYLTLSNAGYDGSGYIDPFCAMFYVDAVKFVPLCGDVPFPGGGGGGNATATPTASSTPTTPTPTVTLTPEPTVTSGGPTPTITPSPTRTRKPTRTPGLPPPRERSPTPTPAEGTHVPTPCWQPGCPTPGARAGTFPPPKGTPLQ